MTERGAEAFVNRLKKNFRHLKKWAKREGVTCWRVYDRDLHDYNVAVDLYEHWVHVQEFERPPKIDDAKAQARLDFVMATVPEALDVRPEDCFVKVRRRQKGGTQYEKLGERGELVEVHEGGHTFLVNFTDYLDTGLFLDHRITRAILAEKSKGKSFLNLFAYTGSATVYAAKGGATSTTTVDMSNTYLDWAAKNFAVNGIREGEQHELVRADCTVWTEKFNSLGARIPRGVLLVGPPGTGKTLLARAVAGEAGVPFFSISGSEFVEMFVGVGASRVRDLFDQAKRNSPCIVFVDEIDAVGRQRGAGLGGSHDEREQTLNQILVEMDGFDTNTNVIVVAATNRPDVLDPALLRPGRFDRQVILDRPDMKGRLEILKVHIKGKPLEKEIDLTVVAKQSPGFSGADLANLVNEAAILAARRNKKTIGLPEFGEALERVVAGPERKSRIISDEEKTIIAYHEGGHAMVQRILPKCDPVAKVSVISRGMALGYTMGLPTEDRYLQSKTEFEDKIAGMLAGNVAERLMFGDTTTGSSNDIEKATNLARRMVTEFGMSEKLGPLAFGKREEMIFLGREIGEQRNYSDDVARMIDDEVRAIIDKAYLRATDVLTTHRDRLTELAEALVAKETIEADEFAAMFADLPDPRSEPGGSPTPKLAGPAAVKPPEAPRTDSEQPATPRQAPGTSPQPA